MKFIAFGVASEVIMVFEDENLRAWSYALSVEIRCRKATDSAADDNQIVFFGEALRRACTVPKRAVTQTVSDFKCPRMAAAESSGSRRIVA